jgi:hypothetical protein
MSRPVVYVVHRIAYQEDPWPDGQRYHSCDVDGQPAGRPEAAFATREEAEEYRRRREREWWSWANPFDWEEDFEGVTSFAEPVFRDWLYDLTGLHGPDPDSDGHGDWQAWFNQVADQLGPQQRERIWEQMDRVELYRVVELALEQ